MFTKVSQYKVRCKSKLTADIEMCKFWAHIKIDVTVNEVKDIYKAADEEMQEKIVNKRFNISDIYNCVDVICSYNVLNVLLQYY